MLIEITGFMLLVAIIKKFRNFCKKIIEWDMTVYPIYAWWKILLRPVCLKQGHKIQHMFGMKITCNRCGKDGQIMFGKN